MNSLATVEEVSVPRDKADREAAVERDFFWNVMVAIAFEAVWALGSSFVIVSVLIPSYLTELFSPKWLIGFMSAVGVFTVPVQLFAERLAGNANRKRNMWLLHALWGVIFLALGGAGMMQPAGARVGRIVSFCALVAALYLLSNVVSPVYNGLLTDICPLYRRGRLYGYRAATVGIFGIAGLVPAKWILSHFDGLQAYHVAMLMAGGIFFVASLSPMFFRDHIDPRRFSAVRGSGIGAILRDAIGLLPRLIRSANYRVFIFFAIVVAASASVGPFIITFARDALTTTGDVSLRFRLVFLIATMANGIFIGLIPDRFGYKILLGAQGVVGLAAFGVALGAGSVDAVMIAFGLQTCMTLGTQVVLMNLSIELMPGVSPTRLVAAANVLCLPVNVLCPWLCGYVLDAAHGQMWGYPVIFSGALTLAAVGGIGAMLLVQEPRTGRVYEIKVLQRV